MKLVLVSGSMRSGSQSLKVSEWLKTYAINELAVEAELIDLHELRLPLYDVGESDAGNKDVIINALESSDAAVFVSPEWNGTMSHGILNMLQYVDKELAHKPVMLVGVSSGRGGHYPLMQMRNMVYKNSRFVISPESLLVQGVNDVLNDHEAPTNDADKAVKSQADYALRILVEYAKALVGVRGSGVIDHETHPNGV